MFKIVVAWLANCCSRTYIPWPSSELHRQDITERLKHNTLEENLDRSSVSIAPFGSVACASGSFVGQAAKKTKEIMDKAIGKVLFIDEAYGLNPRHGGGGASFMQEVSTRVEGKNHKFTW